MKKKSYTLIEIMLVVVIAALLFGIGIPAFSTMIQGNSMTIAIRQLSAKIQAARAYAVMNRCRVALLLPNENTTGINGSLYLSGYRVCTLDANNSFDSWIEDENWKTLPSGILCFHTQGLTTISGSISDGSSTTYTNMPAIIFTQRGQLDPQSAVTIDLAHGRYINNQFIFTNADSTGFILTQISINPYTGRTITDQNIHHGSVSNTGARSVSN